METVPIFLLMQLPEERFAALCGADAPLINIGGGEDQTIQALAELVAGVVGFGGRLRFDPSKPDGLVPPSGRGL